VKSTAVVAFPALARSRGTRFLGNFREKKNNNKNSNNNKEKKKEKKRGGGGNKNLALTASTISYNKSLLPSVTARYTVHGTHGIIISFRPIFYFIIIILFFAVFAIFIR